MQDSPSSELLIAEVRAALEQGLATGFAQKVAANALGIAMREIALSPASAKSEFERLERLVGRDGDLAARNRRLAQGIRSGTLDTGDSALVGHLVHTTLAKLEIDQPGYPAYAQWKASL